jgi:preprotein translocase subunit SecG
MVGLLTAFHILIAIALILIVLLQSAQGTDIAGAFGGMGSQAAFGPRGTTTFLSKATIALAVLFMVTSVTLSIIGSRSASGNESVLSGEQTSTQSAPAGNPAAPSVPPAAPAPTPPAGAPAVQSNTNGLPGVTAHVSVENPGQPTTPGTPAATVQGGAPAPSAAPPAPATQGGKPATPAPANKAPTSSGQ